MQIMTFITIYAVLSQMTFFSRNTRFSRHFWVCYQALITFNDVWPSASRTFGWFNFRVRLNILCPSIVSFLLNLLIQTNLSVDVGNGLSHAAAATKEVETYLGRPSPRLDEALNSDPRPPPRWRPQGFSGAEGRQGSLLSGQIWKAMIGHGGPEYEALR